MQITINDAIGEKIRLLPNPEVFVNSVLEQALLEREKIRRKMEQAARALLNDYENDPELTAFTALDHEDLPIRTKRERPNRATPGRFSQKSSRMIGKFTASWFGFANSNQA